VVRLAEEKVRGRPAWVCKCDCGNEVTVAAGQLRNGTESCGCLQREAVQRVGLANRKHGHKSGGKPSPEYSTWEAMRARCYRSTNIAWDRYGGRGIKVCDRWKDSFENFLADMGPRPEGCSLDRIDNDGDYTPENCRWSTSGEQSKNRNNNAWLVHPVTGEKRITRDWERVLGLSAGALAHRLRNGWSLEKALTPH
jgi:hypothetical protein